MTGENNHDESIDYKKQQIVNPSKYSTDSKLKPEESNFEDTQYYSTENLNDFNDIVDSLSNINVYSDTRSSQDLMSVTWSGKTSNLNSFDNSNISDSENLYNTSGFNTNSNDNDRTYSLLSSSFPDSVSSDHLHSDDYQKCIQSSSLSDWKPSGTESMSSSPNTSSTSKYSCDSYYRQSPSQTDPNNYMNLKFHMGSFRTGGTQNFDIFTPDTVSDANHKLYSPMDSMYKTPTTHEDYESKCVYEQNNLNEHGNYENNVLEAKPKSSHSFDYQEHSPLSNDNNSYYSRDNGSCGQYEINMSDSEDSNSYVPGGYHPVAIGEVYNNRYKIEAKLGWGYFSTVWLASDLASGPDTFVALKFQRSAKMYTDAVLDEIDLLNTVINGKNSNEWVSTSTVYSKLLGQNYNPSNGVVSYLDNFMVTGPNGMHICVVFEVMGPNILTLIKLYRFQGIPIPLVKKIATHVLLGLDYLHRVCKIIHTDIKPENILITSPLNLYKHSLEQNHKSGNKSNLSNERYNLPGLSFGRVDLNNCVREQNGIGNENDLSYIKNLVRPCYSDPTLTTSYDHSYALQETLLRRPYHHITWNMMKNVDRNLNKSHYHPSVLTSIGLNQFGVRRTRIRTSNGFVQIKPHTLEQFNDPQTIYKICDLGNACWIDKHFTEEIQTRQYRSPEAILNIGYNHLADIWSLACVIFELITGDYLFDPNGKEAVQRDSNHLLLIVELLGQIPNYMIQNSKKAKNLSFNQINKIKRWPLESVLIKKYNMDKKEASEISNFLSCMLRINPSERHTAQQLLSHKWLKE
ncbi:Protein kinase domain protein [Theileria parva strain Muguga]|uniref:non-specific serine/threonine protein kinase n=1 Tax=Theileria parva TaxID=5875 RepID=Q4N1T5_THEPA|nr:Protein kinase domain protein [Theileria parva strain Muguga]EAN31997.1 Protein kinase domain protein [Theileria parva strain Muguga]|eukprot:XP_764280.1 serine/threonine protein kinase [Theileria parva strain Muguga]